MQKAKTKAWRTFICHILDPPSSFTVKIAQKSIFAWTNKCYTCAVCVSGVKWVSVWKTHLLVFILRSLPFWSSCPSLYQRKEGLGLPDASHFKYSLSPSIRDCPCISRSLGAEAGQTGREKTQSEPRQSHFTSWLFPWLCTLGRNSWKYVRSGSGGITIIYGQRGKLRSGMESIVISSHACLNDAFYRNMLQRFPSFFFFLQHNCNINRRKSKLYGV